MVAGVLPALSSLLAQQNLASSPYIFIIITQGRVFDPNPIYWTNKWGVFMSRRTKYSYELRKEILRQYFEDQRSITSLSKKYGISEGNISKWRDMYLYNGDKGIKPINNKYSGKFKEEVLEYYYSHKELLVETAAHFNIPSTSTIRKWICIYEKDGVL